MSRCCCHEFSNIIILLQPSFSFQSRSIMQYAYCVPCFHPLQYMAASIQKIVLWSERITSKNLCYLIVTMRLDTRLNFKRHLYDLYWKTASQQPAPAQVHAACKFQIWFWHFEIVSADLKFVSVVCFVPLSRTSLWHCIQLIHCFHTRRNYSLMSYIYWYEKEKCTSIWHEVYLMIFH